LLRLPPLILGKKLLPKAETPSEAEAAVEGETLGESRNFHS
jgi:hypothetical protein